MFRGGEWLGRLGARGMVRVALCPAPLVCRPPSRAIAPSPPQEIGGKPDVDGFLVGGASLKPEFIDIINAAVVKQTPN